jgi:hypothetical protein
MNQFRYGKSKFLPEKTKGESNMKNLQTPDNETISKTRKKSKTSLPKVLSWIFFIIGTITLFASYVYVSSILTFIGLGLLFWGIIFIYIQPEQSTKKAVVDSTVLPIVASLNRIIHELHYEGRPVYLPPKYLEDSESSKIYISKQKNGEIPEPEITLKHENQFFLENPPGILLTPPGAKLSILFEKQLDTSFTKTDLKFITQNIPKLLTDDLEIAENIEIETKNNQIKIRIVNPAFLEANKENNKPSRSYPYIHHPLLSAIACALTKATGNPVTIENNQLFTDGKTIEATYQIMGKINVEPHIPEIKLEEHLVKRLQHKGNRFLPYITSLLLTAIGSILLAQVAWIAFYDTTILGKDITQIFFGSGTGQATSFGIGLTVFGYFMLGLATFLSGMILYLLKRSKV